MPYGTIKVDNITFTNGGSDTTITVSGLASSTTGDLTVTGTISGAVVRATTVSGVTVTGTTVQGASGTFTSITGGVATITSGVFAAGSASNPSISFTSDPNTGIYSPGADQVAISTGGSGRLFVDASGNVILGTASILSGAPGRALQIGTTTDAASTLQFAATTTGNSYIQFGDGGSPESYAGYLQYMHTNNALLFGTDKQERLRITSAGLVGVGTSSPIGLLQLKYATNVNTSFRNSSAAGLTAGTLVEAVNDGFSAFTPYYIRASEYGFGTDSGGTYVPRFTIDSSGRVGIGTTGPLDSVSVASANYRGLTLETSTLANRPTITFRNTAGSGNSAYIQGNNSEIAFGRVNQDYGGHTESARLDGSGRLLVGTSSTSQASTAIFQGYDGVSTNPGIVRLCKGSATPADGDALGYLTFGDLGQYSSGQIATFRDGGTWTSGTSMPTRLTFSTTADGASSPTERMRISQTGDVFIAKTSNDPTTGAGIVLGYAGGTAGALFCTKTETANTSTTLGVYSTGASAYRFYVGMAGTVYATNTTITGISDARLKENVRDLDDGLGKILQLQPRKFDWKTGKGKDTKDDRGFIAQEFEQVFPDLVEEWKDPAPEGEDPYKAVRADLIPVLVKAIQEQQAMIAELQAEVAALKAQ